MGGWVFPPRRTGIPYVTGKVRSRHVPKAYRILFADSVAALENKVTAALADDWHLIGGVAVSVAVPDAAKGDAVHYLQAVAK